MLGIEQAFAATGDQAVAAGILGGSFAFLWLLSLALIVMLIIARWKIFTKAGEAGWKSIIPIYSGYVQWRIGWKKTGLFWLMIALYIGAVLLLSLSGTFATDARGATTMTSMTNPIFAILSLIMLLAIIVLSLIGIYKLMCSFGHGGGWTVLYLLFPQIMLLILGFGSSQYYGPQD